MDFEDFFETEVAVAVAATASLFSPKVRHALHQGAVYSVAGVLMAGDAVADFARGIRQEAGHVAGSAPKGGVQTARPAAKRTPIAPTWNAAAIQPMPDTSAEAARTLRDPAASAVQG